MRDVELVLCEDCPKPDACATPENRCDLVRMVATSTAASGVPYYVEDRATLRTIARLLSG